MSVGRQVFTLISEFRGRVQGLKYSSVVRYFPSMYKALGSIPCTGKRGKKKKKKGLSLQDNSLLEIANQIDQTVTLQE